MDAKFIKFNKIQKLLTLKFTGIAFLEGVGVGNQNDYGTQPNSF